MARWGVSITTWLVPETQRDLAPERYHAGYKPNVIEPVEAVIYHYTASVSAKGTARWLTMEDDVFLSVHFLIERDGTTRQFIPLEERGAHAGGKSSKLFGTGNVNGRTIGVEVMNVGPLRVGPEGELVTFAGGAFKGVPVSAGGQKINGEAYPSTMWEAYGPEQVDALCNLTSSLCAHFQLLAGDPDGRLIGHEHVDPSRKADPGPAFPWEIVRSAAVPPTADL